MNNILICPKCGTTNLNESQFCIKCGQFLSSEQQIQKSVTKEQEIQNQTQQNNQAGQKITQNIQVVGQQPIQNQTQQNNQAGQKITQNIQVVGQQPIQNNINNTQSSNSSIISFSEYFFILLAVILKPFTAFKEELNKFNEFKNSVILALLVSAVATIISLITTMYNTVRVTSYFSTPNSWEFANLKNIDYLQIIGTSFLIYLGVIVAISAVYYIAGLIIKKQTIFSRLLGIASASIVPALVSSMLISPILSMIFAPLGIMVTVIGFIYTLLIMYEIINQELMLDGDIKIYFNLACLSILGIGGYFILVLLFLTSINSDITGYLKSFGF